MFLKYVKVVLDKYIDEEGEGWTIVDVFGGSGLLSHTAKQLKPKATVIYNDFDGYNERLSKEIKVKIINKINNFNGYKDLAWSALLIHASRKL